jgi:glycine/D-amino acid oxidase-like deaminating enzyme
MKAEAVICGAGIAGIAAAYHLSVRQGMRGVVIVDELPPLSLTTGTGGRAPATPWWR